MPRGARVLVTRPEPGATETAGRLDALGFLPLKLPLQKTLPLAVGPETIPASVATIAVTSANAIRHAPRQLLEGWLHLPCFAVGETTAAACRVAGFAVVVSGGQDAGTLAGTIIDRHPSGPVAYLCGKVRRPLFEEKLAGASIAVVAVETYDTVPTAYPADEIAGVLGNAPVDYALVYSANAAESLAALMKECEPGGLFGNTTLVCISARVARTFSAGSREILVAVEPTETGVLSRLQEAAEAAP